MGRDNHQYGGTKTSILIDKGTSTEKWVPTADPIVISRGILDNLCSLKLVSSGSLCSMVLMGMLNPDGNIRKRSQIYRTDGTQTTPVERADRLRNVNEGKLEPYVCMKISLIRRTISDPRTVEWREPNGESLLKKTKTEFEVKSEVNSQRLAALQMLCGENASDIIPDILSDCYMDHSDFNTSVNNIYLHCDEYSTKMEIPEIDDKTKRVVEWIIKKAKWHNFIIHIAFMDYIEGYMTVYEFFNSNLDPTKQLAISYQAAAVILILLLKGRIMSWDFHSSNLLTNGSMIKGIDLGRIYELGIGNDDRRIKQDRHQIKNFVFSDILDKRGEKIIKPFLHFFNLSVWGSTKTPKERDLDRFSEDYKRILVDFPDQAYEFSTFQPEQKRKLVYEALMMIAFIDGITNTCLYNLNRIKSSSIFRRVFHDAPDFTKRDSGYFTNFEKFLNHFTIDYDIFVSEQAGNGTVVVDMNNALDEICRRLEPMLVPCPLAKRQDYRMFELQDRLDYDSEREGEEGDSEGEEGGSNRRRRRRRHKSNKKKKYKSRKIQSRRKRKITHKRGHNIR